MKLPSNTISARAKYIRMSPRKVRRVLKQIEGRSYKDLVIHSASADDGPVFKRFRPRSQGRGFKIKKPTCHIRVSLTKV